MRASGGSDARPGDYSRDYGRRDVFVGRSLYVHYAVLPSAARKPSLLVPTHEGFLAALGRTDVGAFRKLLHVYQFTFNAASTMRFSCRIHIQCSAPVANANILPA